MLPYIVRHPRTLAAAGVALVVSALAMLSIPVAVRRMIDVGFGGGDGMLIANYFAMLIVIGRRAGGGERGALLLRQLARRARRGGPARRRVPARERLLGPAYFETAHSGEVMSRLTADTTQIKAAAGTAISQALRNLIMLVGALVMMFVTSASLSLLLLVAIPAIVLPLVAYGRLVRRLSRHAQDRLAEASAYAAENLAAVRTMQAFTHEHAAAARFAGSVERAFEAARARLRARAGLTALAIFLVMTSVVGVLWFGAPPWCRARSPPAGSASSCSTRSSRRARSPSFRKSGAKWPRRPGAAERLSGAPGARARDPLAGPSRPPAAAGQGAIAFSDVAFAYPSRPDLPTLEGLSFSVAPRERVALVGPSGRRQEHGLHSCCGSTTLSGRGACRRRRRQGRRPRRAAPAHRARAAGRGAVRRYGRGEHPLRVAGAASPTWRRAAATAQADEFIRQPPQGYETHARRARRDAVGRAAPAHRIARAVLRDAPILLLDEATSALDAESEVARAARARGRDEGRTTLVIAHRLATVQRADRILVMDKGRSSRRGATASSSRAGGLYGRLAELQLGRDAAA